MHASSPHKSSDCQKLTSLQRDTAEKEQLLWKLASRRMRVVGTGLTPSHFKISGEPIQEFMEGAGDNGVLLVAMGTVAMLGAQPLTSNASFAKSPAQSLLSWLDVSPIAAKASD